MWLVIFMKVRMKTYNINKESMINEYDKYKAKCKLIKVKTKKYDKPAASKCIHIFMRHEASIKNKCKGNHSTYIRVHY